MRQRAAPSRPRPGKICCCDTPIQHAPGHPGEKGALATANRMMDWILTSLVLLLSAVNLVLLYLLHGALAELKMCERDLVELCARLETFHGMKVVWIGSNSETVTFEIRRLPSVVSDHMN